jgi:hypothetical protein
LQNDRRKFLQGLGKKEFMKKDYNEQLDTSVSELAKQIAADCHVPRNDSKDLFFKYLYYDKTD